MVATGIAVLVIALFCPQITRRVSLGAAGSQGDAGSEFASITPDGRFVAFDSLASNLVAGDTNGVRDVFVRDNRTGNPERVSINSNGSQGNAQSLGGWLSADGRYVTFFSYADNLVPGDTNGVSDVFVHDRLLHITERISVTSGGAEGNGYSLAAPITPDGRYVVFLSAATNLVPGDTNSKSDVFLRDRQAGTTERVSLGGGGVQGNYDSYGPSVSDDGRYVAFVSEASNLVVGDTNGEPDVFVRDRQSGTTERSNVSALGVQGNAVLDEVGACISGNGMYVAFYSSATNLVPSDVNGHADVFVHDRMSGATEMVSVTSGGAQGSGDSVGYSISADGRLIVFSSLANDLVSGDTNGTYDVFVHDRTAGTTERASVDSTGAQGNGPSGAHYQRMSADGRYVVFESQASNLVPDDTNHVQDVFVKDRIGGTGVTSLCDPGLGGVIACPCSNPPSGSGRGCDNSSATGGAVLSASGGTYLSSDSLRFTTSGEKPAALSILTQWTGTNSTGTVFGMGVRCTSGTFKRLYTKQAVAGSITAPDFAVGEQQISVRSAALGDTILGGQSRWYLVFYRDPIVLGGCPASSTINATQTGRVEWSF